MTEDEILRTIAPDGMDTLIWPPGKWMTIGAIFGALCTRDLSECTISAEWVGAGARTWLIEIREIRSQGRRLLSLPINQDVIGNVVDETTVGGFIRDFLPPRPPPKPPHRRVILQVRPDGDGPVWWPKVAFTDRAGAWFDFVSLDPYDPPGWSAGVDDDYVIDSDKLWDDAGLTLEKHIESMKAAWLEEHGPDDDDEDEDEDEDGEDGEDEDGEDAEGHQWEFKILQR